MTENTDRATPVEDPGPAPRYPLAMAQMGRSKAGICRGARGGGPVSRLLKFSYDATPETAVGMCSACDWRVVHAGSTAPRRCADAFLVHVEDEHCDYVPQFTRMCADCGLVTLSMRSATRCMSCNVKHRYATKRAEAA